MSRIADVVRSMDNQHGQVTWRVGTIMSFSGRKCRVQFGGAPPGVGSNGVDYVDGFVPEVGKKVHCLCDETRGMLIVGSTGSASPMLLMADEGEAEGAPMARIREASEPTETVNSAESDPEYSGTLTSGQFIQGFVRQAEEMIGVWHIQNITQVIADSLSAGIIVRMEMELTLVSGGPRARLVLLENKNGVPAISAPPVRSERLPMDVPTRIPMPLGWPEALMTGQALIGVAGDKMIFPAAFDPKATVYITVQTPES